VEEYIARWDLLLLVEMRKERKDEKKRSRTNLNVTGVLGKVEFLLQTRETGDLARQSAADESRNAEEEEPQGHPRLFVCWGFFSFSFRPVLFAMLGRTFGFSSLVTPTLFLLSHSFFFFFPKRRSNFVLSDHLLQRTENVRFEAFYFFLFFFFLIFFPPIFDLCRSVFNGDAAFWIGMRSIQ
jgi:hypothetical protein